MRGWIRNIVLLLLFTSASFQYNEIEWNESQKLIWTDFNEKGKLKNYAALTATAISFSYTYTETFIEIEVKAVFDKDESWVNMNLANSSLLAHEQLHFDITELVARKFRKKLSESKEITPTFLNKMYNEHVNELKYLQRKYDNETNHSLIKEEQSNWELKIGIELKSYDAFQEILIVRTRPIIAGN